MLFLLLIVSCYACGEDNTEMPTPINNTTINILDATVVEGSGTSTLQFDVTANSAVETAVTVNYTIKGVSAEPNVDFTDNSGSVEIAVGQRSATISIPVLDDEINEVEEKIQVTLSNASNATISTGTAIGVIRDNDQPIYGEDGYETATNFYGYDLEWSDEFDGDALDTEVYNYDIGDGCPNLCGWGNNELEWYTNEPENIFVKDGQLTIRATKSGSSNYNSAKIHTKDKQKFQFGRIDFRIKLPEGQGIWPAAWLLGQNIDAVGWPACGEIDIMEMVGHEPEKVHGTAHWGPQGGQNRFNGNSFSLNKKFSEDFHVFSLVWEANELVWYVDELEMHRLTPDNMQGEQYRFNQAFYMILNVAVGGNWPGSPNDTTVFPQEMVVDYIRYFKVTT